MVDSTVASEGTVGGPGGDLLSDLMAPLRLPERALEALDALAGAAGVLGEIRSELATVREQTEPLAELIPIAKAIKRQVDPMPPTVERISAQAEPLETLLPSLESLERAVVERLEAAQATMQSLERQESQLNERVESLGDQIVSLHRTVSGLQGDVERITERLPDPTRGPLEKARDVLTGAPATEAGS